MNRRDFIGASAAWAAPVALPQRALGELTRRRDACQRH